MNRTTILLPHQLRAQLEVVAKKEKVSLGEMVRRAVEKYLLLNRAAETQDSFLTSRAVFSDTGPRDVAARHDAYLAEEDSE